MKYRTGINDIEKNHWVAWVFDLQGCFSKGCARDESVALIPRAIEEYHAWRSRRDPSFPQLDSTPEFEVVEEVVSRWSGDYYVNAFFEDDKRPLAQADVDEAQQLLGFRRTDLNEVIRPLSPDILDTPIAGEVWGSIRGVLNHIATAEWWYLTRIDIVSDWGILPQDILQRLAFVRGHTLSFLPLLAKNLRVFEKREELWNARKVIRRTLWHEIAHTKQIERYLRQMHLPAS